MARIAINIRDAKADYQTTLYCNKYSQDFEMWLQAEVVAGRRTEGQEITTLDRIAFIEDKYKKIFFKDISDQKTEEARRNLVVEPEVD